MNVITLAQPVRTRMWSSYAVACVVAAVGIAIDILFADVLRSFPLLVAAIVVAVVAFFGGRGPALLAGTVLWLFSQYYLVAHTGGSVLASPALYVSLLFFAAFGAAIILPMEGMFASGAALQRLNDELERRVAERTANLQKAQEQLRTTNANLEALVEAKVGDLRIANDEIQRFAYIVSHDLRAPLVNVLGFTSELEALQDDMRSFLRDAERAAPDLVTAHRRELVETELPEALGFIRASTAKMDRLINAILKLSREGRRQLTPEPIDLAALVASQRDSLAQQLASRDATLTVEDALPPLVSDRLAVEQVLGNLVENAVKYLDPARPGRVAVSGRAHRGRITIDIADNGRGIDPRDFERVFELFRRSGEQDTPGEGIGLATVRNLARRLGGDVTVRSELGEGSVFSIELPAVLRPERSDASANAAH